MKGPSPEVLQEKIISDLKNKFPEMADSIRAWIGPLVRTEETDKLMSYNGPSIFVAILPSGETEEALAPYSIRINYGLVVALRTPSAAERDAAGWALTWKVISFVYRNCWGFANGMEVTSAKVVRFMKMHQTPGKTPTGIDYWTVQFYHDVMLG